MRIISGQHKGKTFMSPHSHLVHPMSEKIRGALFAMLGDISGLTILDAFGGSGAVSFEAISRGALKIVCIEQSKAAYQSIVSNSRSLLIGKNQLQVFSSNVYSWIEHHHETFDIVIADPPYNQSQQQLNRLSEFTPIINDSGLLVISFPTQHRDLNFQGESDKQLELVKEKNYGDAQLVFYRKIS